MNAGSVLAQFTVTLTKPATEPVAVLWRTVDGTAKAGVDYAAAAGTVNFAVGEDTKTLEVLIYGRAVGSEDRNFSVLLLPPGNAILGQSVAECIISVDTSGISPVIDIILPDGPQGAQGKSAYQSWLDTGHTGSEEDFVNWLRPTPEEIAEEIAPQINVGDSSLTTKDTGSLSQPDTLDVKTLSKRVAYADVALIATVILGDGDNTIEQADFAGDAIDFHSPFISFRIVHNGEMVEADWSVGTDGKLTIHSATAGDVLYGVEYRIASKRGYGLTVNNNALSDTIREVLRANISAAESGVNNDIIDLTGLTSPITAPPATADSELATLGQAFHMPGGYIGQSWWHDMRAKMPDGCVASDGQEVDQVGPFADLYADVAAGNRPTTDEATWWADVTKRNCYVLNSSTGKMRLPDRNGVQVGSIKAPVMRGDGGTLAAGSIQKSAVPNIKGSTTSNPQYGFVLSDAVQSGPFRIGQTNFLGFSGTGGGTTARALTFDASLVSDVFVDGVTEARMNALGGCYVIRYAGRAQNAGSLDAMTLSARMESINTDLQAKNIATNARMAYALVDAGTIALNTRTVFSNPFGINTPVNVVVEAQISGKWAITGWITTVNGTQYSSYGLSAGFVSNEGIVVQAGTGGVTGQPSAVTGGLHGLVTLPSNSAPVRIHVFKVSN